MTNKICHFQVSPNDCCSLFASSTANYLVLCCFFVCSCSAIIDCLSHPFSFYFVCWRLGELLYSMLWPCALEPNTEYVVPPTPMTTISKTSLLFVHCLGFSPSYSLSCLCFHVFTRLPHHQTDSIFVKFYLSLIFLFVSTLSINITP